MSVFFGRRSHYCGSPPSTSSLDRRRDGRTDVHTYECAIGRMMLAGFCPATAAPAFVSQNYSPSYRPTFGFMTSYSFRCVLIRHLYFSFVACRQIRIPFGARFRGDMAVHSVARCDLVLSGHSCNFIFLLFSDVNRERRRTLIALNAVYIYI